MRRPYTPRAPSPSTLIVVEGSKTEPNYFKGLRSLLRLTAAQVDIYSGGNGCGTDPLTLVEHAAKQKNARKRSRPFEAVWVVVDHEQVGNNPRLQQGLELAARNQIRVALSNPSFEVWLLWHHRFTTRTYTNCDAVIDDLKQHHANYAKGGRNLDQYFPLVDKAVEHAARARHHWRAHTDGFPNAMSDVDFLVIYLQRHRRDNL